MKTEDMMKVDKLFGVMLEVEDFQCGFVEDAYRACKKAKSSEIHGIVYEAIKSTEQLTGKSFTHLAYM